MPRPELNDDAWRQYLAAFHDRHPGITEDILAAATSHGINPYQWLLELIPSDANLLDLACGSAPLLAAGWTGRWVGIDRSEAELDRARIHAGRTYVIGEAHDLPFDDGEFTAIACSMALMLVQPLDDCLAEAARVLAPGGTMVVLLPGAAVPLTARDMLRWVRLLSALRQPRLTYPNDRDLRRLRHRASQHGLSVDLEERRRFALPITTADTADRFVDSLYLPRVANTRIAAARQVARTWKGAQIGIPLRRVRLHRRR